MILILGSLALFKGGVALEGPPPATTDVFVLGGEGGDVVGGEGGEQVGQE